MKTIEQVQEELEAEVKERFQKGGYQNNYLAVNANMGSKKSKSRIKAYDKSRRNYE